MATAASSSGEASPWTADDLRRALLAAGDIRKIDFRAKICCGNSEPMYHIIYFPVRGLAEVPRLLLAEADVTYTFECIGPSIWKELKAQFTFGKLPVLANFDGCGSELANSHAITRHIARAVGLAGSTAAEAALVDMVYTQFIESLGWFVYEIAEPATLMELRAACEAAAGEAVASEPAGANGRVARRSISLKDISLRDGSSTVQTKLAALASFEEMLSRSGTGFLIGSTVTYADLALWSTLSELTEADTCPSLLSAFGWDRLQAFHDSIEQRPRLHAYLTSEIRMPRTGPHPTEGWGLHGLSHIYKRSRHDSQAELEFVSCAATTHLFSHPLAPSLVDEVAEAALSTLGNDALVCIARNFDAQTLAAFLASCRDWRSAVFAPELWRRLAITHYPRVSALAATVPTNDYRSLFRAQLEAERADRTADRPLSDFVFTVELYFKRGRAEEICGSWTGKFHTFEFECSLWDAWQGPEWTRVQDDEGHNQIIDFTRLFLRVLVTKVTHDQGAPCTLLLYEERCDEGSWDGRLEPEWNRWTPSSLSGSGMIDYYSPESDYNNPCCAELAADVLLPLGRVRLVTALVGAGFQRGEPVIIEGNDHLLTYLQCTWNR